MDKQKALEMVLELRDQGVSYDKTAKRLGEAGYLSPKTKSLPTAAMVAYMIKQHEEEEELAAAAATVSARVSAQPKRGRKPAQGQTLTKRRTRTDPLEKKIEIAIEVLAMTEIKAQSRVAIASRILAGLGK